MDWREQLKQRIWTQHEVEPIGQVWCRKVRVSEGLELATNAISATKTLQQVRDLIKRCVYVDQAGARGTTPVFNHAGDDELLDENPELLEKLSVIIGINEPGYGAPEKTQPSG